MPDARPCDEIRDLLPELAAGVASGDDRARALSHLADCAACRRELTALTAVLDGLVLLAPEHEPSPGFETRVLAAMGPAARRGRPRLPGRVLTAVAASVVAAAVAGGTLWWVTADDRRAGHQYEHTLAEADGRYFVAAQVSGAAGRDVGTVFAYEGDPSWLFVTLDGAAVSGRYLVEVVTTDQQHIDIGWCDVSDGRGSWGRTVRVPVGEIRRVELTPPSGPTLRARFERT
jgi:hypothetical protein